LTCVLITTEMARSSAEDAPHNPSMIILEVKRINRRRKLSGDGKGRK
jgi:hypothetical protein